MKDSRISRLKLSNFRSHKSLDISTDSNIISLYGDNGVGKTTALEAISLLSPGKGMLAAKNSDLNRLSQDGHQSCYNNFYEINNGVNISIFNKGSGEKYEKVISINKKKNAKQIELLDWCDVLWFNGKMQYDLHSSTNKRNFFDRITFSIFPDQARMVSDYKVLCKKRIDSLQNNRANSSWLDSLEFQMASLSEKIAENRVKMMELINEASSSASLTAALVKIDGLAEGLVGSGDVKTVILEMLNKNRTQDSFSGRTSNGIHRSEVIFTDKAGKNVNELSNGWQKMIFIGLIEASAKVISKKKGSRPILLFDEMVSFLDDKNMNHVLESLLDNLSQVWLTNCNQIKNKTSIKIDEFHIENILTT